MKKPILKEIIALIGALVFIAWLPFQVGFYKVNASSPIVQTISQLPIIHDISVSFSGFEGWAMFAVFMVACLLAFVWAVKRNSR